MNIIYITGATSCGKTMLANKLSDKSTILSLDALSKSVRFIFNDFKLYTDKIFIRPSINNDKFLLLVKNYINCFNNDYPNIALIVEGCHFTPNEFLSEFPNAKVIAIGITSGQVALQQINKKEWMSNLDEEIKQEYVKEIVKYSNYLKTNKNGYEYIEFELNE